jgi:hypothetical protein
MKSISNERAFAYYRGRISDLLQRYAAQNFDLPDADSRAFLVVNVYFGRYSARGGAIEGTAGYGAIPLADRGAATALIARSRARDAAEVEKPLWRSSLDGFIERCTSAMIAVNHQIDARDPMAPHGYAPSLRALFNQAKRTGLSDDEAWGHIKEWALRPPKRAAAPAPALAPQFAQAAAWRETGDLDFPWTADVAGEVWRVRLNDFPEEPMYTLFVGDEERGTFHDWPDAWERKDAPPQRKQAAPGSPAIAGAAAARWLGRYGAGEHEAVWAELVSLGPDVRSRRYRAPAWSVAQATMRRARHNVETIIRRLDGLGYRFIEPREQVPLADKQVAMPTKTSHGFEAVPMKFGDMQQRIAATDLSRLPPNARDSLEHMRQLIGSLSVAVSQMQDAARLEAAKKPPKSAITSHLITSHVEDPDVFLAANAAEAKLLAKLERRKLYVPLSLRAWIETVGRVDLNGAHRALCFLAGPEFPGIYADPLCIVPTAQWAEEVLAAWDEEGRDADDPQPLFISFPARDKPSLATSDEQIEDAYEIALPNAAADAELLGEPQQRLFVDYLRHAFRWGGFPGWEQYDKRPEAELALLRQDLLPI